MTGLAASTDVERHFILEALFTSITDTLLVLNSDLIVVDANEPLLRALGKVRDEVVGQAWECVFPILAEIGRDQDLKHVLVSGRLHRGRIPLVDPRGHCLLFEVVTYPVCDLVTGRVTHLVEYAREVSEEVKLQLQIVDTNQELVAAHDQLESQAVEINAARQLLEEKCTSLEEANTRLERLAVLDVMTDMPNHRAFQERLAHEAARSKRQDRPFSLIMFDVDNFKRYNDQHGHPQGDVLLAQLAKVVRENARAEDLPARYGGEEFAVILPYTNKHEALAIADRLRVTIGSSAFRHGQVTVSMGVAEFPGDASEPGDLVTCADQAMYHAKSLGKNSVSLWAARTEHFAVQKAALSGSAALDRAMSSEA